MSTKRQPLRPSTRATDDRRTSTLFGAVAIFLWASNVGISRSAAESVGALTAGAWMFLVGGLIGCVYDELVNRRFREMLRLPRTYLLGGGALFAAYMLCLYAAIGMAVDRRQTIEVGVLNYLWPSLTLVFAIPILGVRVSAIFPIGVVLALAGAVLAPLQIETVSGGALAANLLSNPGPYVLATTAAILWALYSNLSRKWAGHTKQGAVPLFSVATGLLLFCLRPLFPEPASWTARALAEVGFLAVFPGVLAYAMWDRAVRRGNVTLVAALSYAIPVLSTFMSSLYLGVPVAWNVWLGCVFTVVGAGLASRGVRSE